jgi:hypothetical protein
VDQCVSQLPTHHRRDRRHHGVQPRNREESVEPGPEQLRPADQSAAPVDPGTRGNTPPPLTPCTRPCRRNPV